MKNVTQKKGGRQIVVFDQVLATLPAGVHIDAIEAKKRFKDGVIPAGTLVVPSDEGKYKPVNETFSDANIAEAVGLTYSDIEIDDFPLVSIVVSGTARIDALPDKEKAGVGFMKKVLTRITFY